MAEVVPGPAPEAARRELRAAIDDVLTALDGIGGPTPVIDRVQAMIARERLRVASYAALRAELARVGTSDVWDWMQSKMGLHESIEFLYVVDGYEATLVAGDGDLPVLTAKGETLREAVEALRADAERREPTEAEEESHHFPDDT